MNVFTTNYLGHLNTTHHFIESKHDQTFPELWTSNPLNLCKLIFHTFIMITFRSIEQEITTWYSQLHTFFHQIFTFAFRNTERHLKISTNTFYNSVRSLRIWLYIIILFKVFFFLKWWILFYSKIRVMLIDIASYSIKNYQQVKLKSYIYLINGTIKS